MTVLLLAIAVFLASQLLDVVSTVQALRFPHLREANPLVRWTMARTGSALLGLVVSKAITSPIVVTAALIMGPSLGSWILLGGLVSFYAWIIERNFRLARP
jgi:hypothetical protein